MKLFMSYSYSLKLCRGSLKAAKEDLFETADVVAGLWPWLNEVQKLVAAELPLLFLLKLDLAWASADQASHVAEAERNV